MPTPAPDAARPPVRLLLATARSIVARSHGALVRLSTLDGEAWGCACVDPDALSVLADLPSGTGPTPRAAVVAMLDALHDALRRELSDVAAGPGPARCEPAADAPRAEVA
ncbi:MAG: hypothetical protein U0324_29320 [Polyangiales bacterium]